MTEFFPPTEAYIGLGSNLEDPLLQVRRAVSAVGDIRGIEPVKCSAIYRSAAVGPAGQPDYINAVIRVICELGAQQSLRALLDLERQLGRVRGGERWGPRIIDLDLLLYGSEQHATEQLTLPHPRIAERPFVLIPLADVAEPSLIIPGAGLVRDLVARADRSQLSLVDYN